MRPKRINEFETYKGEALLVSDLDNLIGQPLWLTKISKQKKRVGKILWEGWVLYYGKDFQTGAHRFTSTNRATIIVEDRDYNITWSIFKFERKEIA